VPKVHERARGDRPKKEKKDRPLKTPRKKRATSGDDDEESDEGQLAPETEPKRKSGRKSNVSKSYIEVSSDVEDADTPANPIEQAEDAEEEEDEEEQEDEDEDQTSAVRADIEMADGEEAVTDEVEVENGEEEDASESVAKSKAKVNGAAEVETGDTAAAANGTSTRRSARTRS
jgi:sister-chromatid-cohesion protein PDS5